MAVVRWKFEDPAVPEEYTFPINPRRMTSPFPVRNIKGAQTTAVSGTSLVWEGSTPPYEWKFGGVIRTKAHHDELLRWSQKRNRFYVYDHFGRRYAVAAKQFSTDNEKINRAAYWYHQYDFTVLVLPFGGIGPTAATVEEVWT